MSAPSPPTRTAGPLPVTLRVSFPEPPKSLARPVPAAIRVELPLKADASITRDAVLFAVNALSVMPESIMFMVPAVSELLVSVMSVFLVAATVEVAPLPVSDPVPVQPVTSKVLALDPPVRLAVSKPLSVQVRAVPKTGVIARDAVARVKFASLP